MEHLTLIDWAQRAYWVLNAARLEGRTVYYSDLAEAIGYPHAIWHQEFGTVLYLVLLADVNVAATCVGKDTGLPGKGFWEAVDRHGLAKKLDPPIARPEGL